MAVMQWAFNTVGLAVSGIILQFSRLFSAFDMGSFIYPILIISVVFWFLISPFVHRVHDGAMDGVYLRTKIGRDQINDNRVQRRENQRNYDYERVAKAKESLRKR